VSSRLHCAHLWKRRSVLVSSAVLMWVGVAVPVYASVTPGTKVTASSSDLKLNIQANGVPDTVTCGQVTDTFVVTSKDSAKATIPPPTADDCTDALEPDQPDASDELKTNDKNGNWKLEAAEFGSGGCTEGRVLGLEIPREGAALTSALLSSCEGILAPSGPLLLTGKYDPSAGTLKLKNALVPIRGSCCTYKSPALLSVTITFNPNLGPVPPFAS
jgi:hypothetical protein